MNECCENEYNIFRLKGTEIYKDGYFLLYVKRKCKICGKVHIVKWNKEIMYYDKFYEDN